MLGGHGYRYIDYYIPKIVTAQHGKPLSAFQGRLEELEEGQTIMGETSQKQEEN